MAHAGSHTRFHAGRGGHTGKRKDPRLVSRSGFRPFISNCEAALSRRASRASWSGRLLDDASDQYRRPASHWPLLLGAVENRPGDDGQEEARGRRRRGTGCPEGVRDNRADLPSFLPSFILPQPPATLCSPFRLSFSRPGCSFPPRLHGRVISFVARSTNYYYCHHHHHHHRARPCVFSLFAAQRADFSSRGGIMPRESFFSFVELLRFTVNNLTRRSSSTWFTWINANLLSRCGKAAIFLGRYPPAAGYESSRESFA